MIKRADKNTAGKTEKLNENSQVSNDFPKLLSNRQSKENLNAGDDLIISLSNAYENKRARQVFEWETVRRMNVQRAV